jgi:hypothetical protein
MSTELIEAVAEPTSMVWPKEISRCSRDVHETLDHVMIAELPSYQLKRMTRKELIRVVQASGLLSQLPGIETHLEFFDRQRLEQMACLARRCCQHQEQYGVAGVE